LQAGTINTVKQIVKPVQHNSVDELATL